LPELSPGRALGFRAWPNLKLGLDDFREAIELATRAGQGREVALLHNNLGWNLLAFVGPAASMDPPRDAKSRGLTEMLDGLTQSTIDLLVETGEHEEALTLAAEIVPRLEASRDVWGLIGVRGAQAQILALRGQGTEVAEVLEWLESAARGAEDPQFVVSGLGSSALVRAGLGQSEAAGVLLTEVVRPGPERDVAPRWCVAPGVRSELGSWRFPLAPSAEHAIVAANAAPPTRRNLQAAADATPRLRIAGFV
jgi:hypothetical protein